MWLPARLGTRDEGGGPPGGGFGGVNALRRFPQLPSALRLRTFTQLHLDLRRLTFFVVGGGGAQPGGA